MKLINKSGLRFAFFMHNCHCEERNNEAISKKLASPRNDK